MTILVTGGAGFIGSHLCEALIRNGDRVICIDNFDPFYARSIKEDNLAWLREQPGFTFVEGDIRDRATVQSLFAGQKVDAVAHLAAKAGVRPSILAPMDYLSVNVTGTGVLLEAMREAGCKRLVFASSSSVYGNQLKTPFSETDEVGHPISPYAATKRSGELLCHTYCHLFGFDIVCLRFFTVFGPRQRPDLAIRKFAELALAGKPIPLYGDGATRRDYTFVGDIVGGVFALLQQHFKGYEIVNIGCGNPVSLLDMVRAVEKALGKPVDIQFSEKQPGDVEQTHADISKAARMFGYQPSVSLEAGVQAFLDWYKG